MNSFIKFVEVISYEETKPFLAAIFDELPNSEPQLIFADYLMERGEELGELIHNFYRGKKDSELVQKVKNKYLSTGDRIYGHMHSIIHELPNNNFYEFKVNENKWYFVEDKGNTMPYSLIDFKIIPSLVAIKVFVYWFFNFPPPF